MDPGEGDTSSKDGSLAPETSPLGHSSIVSDVLYLCLLDNR